MVICLERGADLHMAQLMPLPLTVSCFSKIQIGFTFLLPAHLGSPGKRAIKWVCVCVCDWMQSAGATSETPRRHSAARVPRVWAAVCAGMLAGQTHDDSQLRQAADV